MVTPFARPSYQSANDSHTDSEQIPSRNALEIQRLTTPLEGPIAAQLIAAQLIAAQLIAAQLIAAQLIAAQLIAAQLIAAQLIAVQPMPLDLFLTTKQAAVILGRSPETLKKWRQHGKGPKFVRHSDGAIRYSLNELMKFVQDCTVER